MSVHYEVTYYPQDSEDPKVDDHLKIGEQPELDSKPAKSPKKIPKIFVLHGSEGEDANWHLRLDKISAIGPLEIYAKYERNEGTFQYYLEDTPVQLVLLVPIRQQYDALVQAWTQYHEEN